MPRVFEIFCFTTSIPTFWLAKRTLSCGDLLDSRLRVTAHLLLHEVCILASGLELRSRTSGHDDVMRFEHGILHREVPNKANITRYCKLFSTPTSNSQISLQKIQLVWWTYDQDCSIGSFSRWETQNRLRTDRQIILSTWNRVDHTMGWIRPLWRLWESVCRSSEIRSSLLLHPPVWWSGAAKNLFWEAHCTCHLIRTSELVMSRINSDEYRFWLVHIIWMRYVSKAPLRYWLALMLMESTTYRYSFIRNIDTRGKQYNFLYIYSTARNRPYQLCIDYES